ncbi:MAG: fibronectin type III domain-containing protein, partial [Pontiellaceae bacterium]|nr:fibronectin type III domain-containing protein [Pontiellaceae bacterium]
MNSPKKLLTFLCLTLFSGFCVWTEDSAQNVRVVWSGDARTEAVIVWDTIAADENSVLMYDTVSRTNPATGYAFDAPVKRTGPYIPGNKDAVPSAPENPVLFYHHAELNHLKPDTVYYLAVKTGDEAGR